MDLTSSVYLTPSRRIKFCIQRFRSRRRLSQEQSIYFNDYLFLGGIDSQHLAFHGHDPRELKELTPAERRDIQAYDIVHSTFAGSDRFYNGDQEHWSINFSAVVKGYLSTSMPRLTDLQQAAMDKAIAVVENFLRYVLQHDVCPEYRDDVMNALDVCENARKEWPALDLLQAVMPGQFNMAASEWCCDRAEDFFSRHGLKRPPKFHPYINFYIPLLLASEPTMTGPVDAEQTISILEEVICTLEFTTVERCSQQLLKQFADANLDYGMHSAPFKPLGKAKLRPVVLQDGWARLESQPESINDGVELYIEDEILAHVHVGMKMDAVVCKIAGDWRELWIVKEAGNMYPSFYEFLPQELMRGFKPPRENERSAPSVYDHDKDNLCGDTQVD